MDPKKKISSEIFLRSDQTVQIFVGGRDNAHICRNDFIAAHGTDFLIFQGPEAVWVEEIGADPRSHLRNRVPPRSRFKGPFAIAGGAGETSFYVAE